MRCIKLNEDTINILGIHYSYNKQLENVENFIMLITSAKSPEREGSISPSSFYG